MSERTRTRSRWVVLPLAIVAIGATFVARVAVGDEREPLAGEGVAPADGSSSADEPATSATSPDAVDAVLKEVGKELDTSFLQVRGLLESEHDALMEQTAEASTPAFLGAVEALAGAGADDRTAASRLSAELDAARDAVGIERLFFVTQSDQIFSAPELPADELTKSSLVSALTSSAAAAFGTPHRNQTAAVLALPYPDEFTSPQASPRLFLVAAKAVFARPDAPYGVLLGVTSFSALRAKADSIFVSSAASLDWNVVCLTGVEAPYFALGPHSGELVPKPILAAIESEALSAVVGTQDGQPFAYRWGAVKDTSGETVGAWGVAANQRFLKALIESGVDLRSHSESANGVKPRRAKPGAALILAAAAGFIVVLFGLVFWLLRRRQSVPDGFEEDFEGDDDDYEPEEHESVPPPAPKAANGDLMTQFELNWKTFASYTQDLLRQSLKEIEEAPERDLNAVKSGVESTEAAVAKIAEELKAVRSEIGNPTNGKDEMIAQALVELKNQFSIVRDESRNSLNGVVRKITAAMNEKLGKGGGVRDVVVEAVRSQTTESQRLLEVLNDTVVGLTEMMGDRQEQETQRRLDETVSNVTAQWKEHVIQYQEQIQELTEKCEQAQQEVEDSKDLERDLRAEVEESLSREAQMERRLEEWDASSGERDTTIERQRRELEALEAQESAARAEVDTLEHKVQELQSSLTRLSEREESDKTELAELHQSAAAASARVEALTTEYEELEARHDELQQAADKQKRSQQRHVAELEETVEELRRIVGEDLGEPERLREQSRAQKKEIDALKKAFDAVKQENDHLLEENARLAESGEEQARIGQEKLHEQLETERTLVVELRKEIAEKDVEVSRRDVEIEQLKKGLEESAAASGAADIDRLRTSLLETGKELRSSLQERLRLNATITEKEADWQTRLNDLELQLAESERQRREATKKLEASQRAVEELEEQLESTQQTVRPDGGTLERLQNLKREKELLVRSMDQLRGELEKAQQEAEEVRRFHYTLVDESLNTAIIACHKDLTVFGWNPCAERLWDLSASETLGHDLGKLRLPEVLEIKRTASAVVREGVSREIGKRMFRDPSGAERHVRIQFEPVLDRDKNLLGLVISATDITAAVEQEIEARLQGLFAESLSESLPSALIVLDSKERVTSWNRAAEVLFGLDAEDAIGADLFQLPTPLKRQAFRRRFEKVKEQAKPRKVRLRLDHRGRESQCLVTQAPFRGRDDDCVRGTLLVIEAEETVRRK